MVLSSWVCVIDKIKSLKIRMFNGSTLVNALKWHNSTLLLFYMNIVKMYEEY